MPYMERQSPKSPEFSIKDHQAARLASVALRDIREQIHGKGGNFSWAISPIEIYRYPDRFTGSFRSHKHRNKFAGLTFGYDPYRSEYSMQAFDYSSQAVLRKLTVGKNSSNYKLFQKVYDSARKLVYPS